MTISQAEFKDALSNQGWKVLKATSDLAAAVVATWPATDLRRTEAATHIAAIQQLIIPPDSIEQTVMQDGPLSTWGRWIVDDDGILYHRPDATPPWEDLDSPTNG